MKGKGAGWHNESHRHRMAGMGIKTGNMSASGRIDVKETEIFQFDELPQEIQNKVIENLYNINVNYQWWDISYDYFKEQLNKIGIDAKSFFFSLDRNNYIYMDEPRVINDRKFMKWLGIDLRSRDAKNVLEGFRDIGIKTQHFGGGDARNYVEYDGGTEKQHDDFDKILNNKLNEFKESLNEEYNYLTSREEIIETIKANEYEFTKDGEIYG